MSCGGNLGKFRWFWTGNQVGDLNHTGDFNFAAGGPKGSGISAGLLVKRFFQKEVSRNLWEYPNAVLNQALLNASFPFIELKWIIDIKLSNVAHFRVSDRNIYVTDENGDGRFYEARVIKAPIIGITTGEWLAPNFEIGDLKIDLNNRDGYFNEYLPQGIKYLQWIGCEVSVKVGFGEKISNYFEVFKGFVTPKQGVTGTHEILTLKCYDKTSEDAVTIPTLTFDKTNYPNVDTDKLGKFLPIIYGDWSVEVGDYGEIPAYCSNANDSLTTDFNWQISENSLMEIGDVYLHRGNSVVGKDGPIKLDDSVIVKDPKNGRIIIPSQYPVLSRVFIILDRARAGAGSELNQILSESPSVDFVKLGIRPGDVVIKDGDPNNYVITTVGSGQITTATGTFIPQDNYRVITDKFVFRKGDKISVFCKGKDLKIMSTNRISDTGLLNSNPRGLSIGLDNSYWTYDNAIKKIHQISFNNTVIQSLNFSDIDPAITILGGLQIAFDGTLWVVDKKLSKIFRFLLKEKIVGLTIATKNVDGINRKLDNITGFCIDDDNQITIVDNTTGQFFKMNPFGPIAQISFSWNRIVFETNATDITDIAVDVNKSQILVVDRATNKFFRINETTGELISGSDFNLNTLSSNFTYPNGVGYYLDGTIFLLNRNDNTIYNVNEFPTASTNIGFICRDILQKYAGKTSFDFDLMWNETSRDDLGEFKARVYIKEQTTAIQQVHKLLLAYNANAFIRFQKYGLFQIAFKNFRTDGDMIREGDIKLNSFNPSKEYGQYFNVATAKYKDLPFTGSQIISDTYASPSGIKMSGAEIPKSLDMEPVYNRDDLDKLIPLFVRLAAAEPEFINLSVGFRFLFVQPNVFFNINFFDYDVTKRSGRRFNNIPSFVRKIDLDLGTMEVKMKLWSLGTTQFGNFLPVGTIAGGENDQVILTNLGTPGWISPVGSILSADTGSFIIEDVNSINAESRSESSVGLAWKLGHKIDVIDATTHTVVETLTITTVNGNTIYTSPIQTTILPTVKNAAGFIVGGHFIKYSTYEKVIAEQKVKFAYYGKPIEGYPTTTTTEIEELRAGKMHFEDQRLPYLLHPALYVPTIV